MKREKAQPSTAITANLRKVKQEEFAQWCKDKGLIQADTLGAIIDWYMTLDGTTRALVTDALEARDMAAVSVLALERVASDAGVDVAEMQAVRQVFVDRVKKSLDEKRKQSRA